MPKIAACAFCENLDCQSVVVLPAVPDTAKKFDFRSNRLEVACPACSCRFSISPSDIIFRDVTKTDFSIGYIAF